MLRTMLDRQIARVKSFPFGRVAPDIERQIPGRIGALASALGVPEFPDPVVGKALTAALVVARCGDPSTLIQTLPSMIEAHWEMAHDHRVHGAVRFGRAFGLAQTLQVGELAASKTPGYRLVLEWLTLFGIDALYQGTLDGHRGLLDAVSELITKEDGQPVIEAIGAQAQFVSVLPQIIGTVAPWSFDAQIAALEMQPLAPFASSAPNRPHPYQSPPQPEPGHFFFPNSFALNTSLGIVIGTR